MFPLLSLPFLAVKEVFRSMDHKELFFASLISSQTKQAIRSSLPKNSVRISLGVGIELDVSIESFYLTTKASLKRQGRPLYRIGTQSFFLVCYNPIYSMYYIKPRNRCYKQTYHGLKEVFIRHLVETFNNPIVRLSVDGSERGSPAVVTKYFKQQGVKMESVSVSSVQTVEEYTAVLDACSDIPRLFMTRNPELKIQYRPSRPFTVNHVTLSAALSWIYLEDFIQCERFFLIPSVDPNESRMTPEYLNSFLKSLISTGSRVKEWSIGYEDLESFPRIVDGLSDKPIQENAIVMHTNDGKSFKVQLTTYGYLKVILIE